MAKVLDAIGGEPKTVDKYADLYNVGGRAGARAFMRAVSREMARMGRTEQLEAVSSAFRATGDWRPLKHTVTLELKGLEALLGCPCPGDWLALDDLLNPLEEDEDVIHGRVLELCALLSDDEGPEYQFCWNDGAPYIAITLDLREIG